MDLLVPSVRSGRLDLRLSMDDLPGLAFDETPFSPRVRLAVDSTRPIIDSISLGGVPEGSPISIGQANALEVILITNDENGFNVNEAAVLHYRVKAGEAEISRGSVLLPDITPFGQQYFWSGMLDLTDSGATTLLPSYTVDVWVSGSDEAGNPYDTVSNSMNDAFASWPLSLLGPRIDLQDEGTSLQWDVPSPYVGETAVMVVNSKNLGGNGNVEFALQQLVDGSFWASVSTVSVDVTADSAVTAALPVVADAVAGSTVEYRVLVLVDGVEMDRHTVDSLLIKEETVRDGAALSQQLSADVFSVTLFVIALVSVSFGMYALVLRRRMLAPESEEEMADQTDVVAEEMAAKAVPALAAVQPPAPPHRQPLPLHLLQRHLLLRTYLVSTVRNPRPFLQRVFLMAGPWSNGRRMAGNTLTHFPRSEGWRLGGKSGRWFGHVAGANREPREPIEHATGGSFPRFAKAHQPTHGNPQATSGCHRPTGPSHRAYPLAHRFRFVRKRWLLHIGKSARHH